MPGSQPDPYLSAEDIAKAMHDGLRDAGIDLRRDADTYSQAVDWTFNHLYSSLGGFAHLRYVTGIMAIYKTGTVDGKSEKVSLCSSLLSTWRAQSEITHAEQASTILAELRNLAKGWASRCLAEGEP